MAVFNIKDLETAIERAQLQLDTIDVSLMLSGSEKIQLKTTYRQQISIYKKRLKLEKVATKNATGLTVFDYEYL